MGVVPSMEQDPPTILAKAQTNGGPSSKVPAAPAAATTSSSTTAVESKPSSLITHDTTETGSPISTESKEMNIGVTPAANNTSGKGGGHLVPQHPGIRDEDVRVNLAMADLMAYLQVVATNSQNLPLTRRDDPDVGKTVSALSSEEYAKKSAAFVPADVRVIGGSFTKYGRVWDLPTMEEFNAVDNAQEPGRSFGGACCNAMLKVLYDAANEAADAARDASNTEALFDDDDDDESLNSKGVQQTRTSESLVLGDGSAESPITWADLIRKMKAEIEEIEYAQAPVVTSTRKLDVSKPFSLVPDDFDATTGKKRSLLIGCNYDNIHGAELKASHDDIRSMKDYIVNVQGFPESSELMTVLIDDDDHEHPTHQNITAALMALSEQSQPGDAVFVQFSGHGGRVLDATFNSEAESYDEIIAPVDYATSGMIRDTLIFKTLLAPMRYGVTVTILIDCSDTGMIIELPYSWSTKKDRPSATAKMTNNNDFSFVRFLKVVKTLYDSSIFTQLGNTVGSALNGPEIEHWESDHETIDNDSTLDTADDITVTAKPAKSLLSALTSCTSPTGDDVVGTKNGRIGNSRRTVSALADMRLNPHSSLLDQVLNTCGVGNDEQILSDDEDTYRTGVDSQTFDSMTDDSTLDSYKERARRQGLV